MNESSTSPPEALQSGDLENFVLLLDGLKQSLAEDRQQDEAD
ncbi:hypothetical protein [Kitasatospora viridis]|uniref:Uncharacterized protein n=1 Tax=Kitasatospora viridis TaxID=281105 RepID=A0A561UG35_9ACTN|nr:hypothetical protein [Kitasatospora viridis]TWF98324.1 hypothetical protein FHX73_112132 [Kitasatospora viridis]